MKPQVYADLSDFADPPFVTLYVLPEGLSSIDEANLVSYGFYIDGNRWETLAYPKEEPDLLYALEEDGFDTSDAEWAFDTKAKQ